MSREIYFPGGLGVSKQQVLSSEVGTFGIYLQRGELAVCLIQKITTTR